MSDIQKIPEHVNLTERTIKEHVPAAGDTYAKRDAHYGGIYSITGVEHRFGKNGEDYGLYYTCDRLNPETLNKEGTETISSGSLKEYYRYVSMGARRVCDLAGAVIAGNAEYVSRKITGEKGGDELISDETALVKGRSKTEVEMMLADAEERENMLQEIQLWAKHIMENRKREVEKRVDEMNTLLAAFRKKVRGLTRIITVMNLYLGREVDAVQIAAGEDADPGQRLCIRQRILYMDEELCAHLDHEADYKDIDLFFDWVKKPENRDIVIPERRGVVALKPKRYNMGYHSGNTMYDAQRELWNKHTYLLVRNGENLWVFDDGDLECYDWVFPHSDFEEKFQANRGESFFESRLAKHEDERYRVMRMMMFLQGLVDRNEIFGIMDPVPNIIKTQNVDLIRDDEMAVGTGIKPWKDFVAEKNALIRRGTRVVYMPGETYRESLNGRLWYSGGSFRRYYAYDSSQPTPPPAGIYNLRQEDGKEKYWFSYNPGGDVWPKNCWEDVHERRRMEGWTPELSHCLNYDAVTSEELQAYFDDRTLREGFRAMMPLLKHALLKKREEERLETAFVDLMTRKEGLGKDAIREAVAWWKEKVIFTRPLRSDDAKAWRMIRNRIKTEKQRAWKKEY